MKITIPTQLTEGYFQSGMAGEGLEFLYKTIISFCKKLALAPPPPFQDETGVTRGMEFFFVSDIDISGNKTLQYQQIVYVFPYLVPVGIIMVHSSTYEGLCVHKNDDVCKSDTVACVHYIKPDHHSGSLND